MRLFAACTGSIYLCAPVTYVGVTQASLCNRLGASGTVANLPATAYFAFTAAPVFVAWLSPSAAALRRNLVLCFAALAAMMAAMSVALISPLSPGVKVALVIVQGAVCGASGPTAIALLWEAIGRGVSESRRGIALGMAFGAGPLLAVVGSLASQVLLTGEVGGYKLAGLDFPRNFSLLFGAFAPVMLFAAFAAVRFVVPIPEVDASREPFARSVFGGVLAFLADPLLRRAALVTVLLYTGNTIASNLNLYTQYALGRPPDDFAGLQNAIRFGFKVVAGLGLGWLLTRTSPKANVLVTASLYLLAQAWAILATGPWYLLTFGIYGAGELVGVYAPNYVLSASRTLDIRRNMAIATLMMAPAAPAASLFGAISDRVGRVYGPAAGFRASFAACAGIMAFGMALALLSLPARPRPGGDRDPLPGADAER